MKYKKSKDEKEEGDDEKKNMSKVSILRKKFEPPKSPNISSEKVRKNSLRNMRKALQTPPSGKKRKLGARLVKEKKGFYVQNTIDMFLEKPKKSTESPINKRKRQILEENSPENPDFSQKIPKDFTSVFSKRKPGFGMAPSAGNAAESISRSFQKSLDGYRYNGRETEEIFEKGSEIKKNILGGQLKSQDIVTKINKK